MDAERQHNQEQAAYWEIVLEDSGRTYEYARKQREYYLRLLGMLAIESEE